MLYKIQSNYAMPLIIKNTLIGHEWGANVGVLHIIYLNINLNITLSIILFLKLIFNLIFLLVYSIFNKSDDYSIIFADFMILRGFLNG